MNYMEKIKNFEALRVSYHSIKGKIAFAVISKTEITKTSFNLKNLFTKACNLTQIYKIIINK